MQAAKIGNLIKTCYNLFAFCSHYAPV